MKKILLKINATDWIFGLLIYLLLLFIFGWATPNASTSYSESFNYGFPGPVVVKEVSTNFCPHPPCKETFISYHLYDNYTHISSNLIYPILADFITLLLLCLGVSFIRRKLLK